MKHFSRLNLSCAAVLLAAAVSFTACSDAPADSAIIADESSMSSVLSSLTEEDVQQLLTGSTTLAELAEQRTQTTEAASSTTDTGTVSSSLPTQETLPETSTEETIGSVSTPEAQPDTPAYEAELQDLLNQLYAVKARAESGLDSAIASAKAEYKALPAEKQTQTRKVAICMSKAGELKALESSCDKEVNTIVSQMRTVLTENGQSTALADQALASYKAQKDAMYASLSSQLYGG